MRLNRLFVTLFVLKICLSICLISYSYYYVYIKPHTQNDKVVVIPHKVSKSEIGRILYATEVIEDQVMFFIVSHLHSFLGNHLLSGEYLFEKGSTLMDVIKKLMYGDVIRYKLTIPEGYTNAQIYDLLNSTDKLTGEIDISKYGEGSLFPATYFYKNGTTKEQLLKQMKNLMSKHLDDLSSQTSLPTPLRSNYELIILASIVEKEASLESERPRIARVYLNRLTIGMPLQADPTVIYALSLGGHTLDGELKRQDLKYVSPYNTYLNKGLPPTPIANPGLASIKAVLHPTDGKELYFVKNSDAGHSFGTTYLEHLTNVRNYRKGQYQVSG
ncbi:endolytic transglycosylase MltG [Rickettsiales endosymbiont of Peranema trichophorum]|uniref:endolytic transglycosylase MltG n=1 Tax=Rickettsiales endosymbiont of Peranema trichophorum TaxID=2486577 RepID=UPI001023C2AC|nr:endolytic transglycosylase MltG [Rickettsiales endosymbiont of Peranema trichophorum]RZI46326.1 endolytic transglycosylase MltG [Rickettsiales endosymbiont of Peranema trichophorum]